MKAAVFYEPNLLKIEEVEEPKIGPEELLVKVELSLTCGTDVKLYKRGHPLVKPPIIIGHEFVGEIVKVGYNVNKFKLGQRVVSANSAPCNSCLYCKIGKPNLCERLDEVIIGFTLNGSYAEYVKIPERIVKQNTFTIPEGTNPKRMALLEPLACVVHGNELANINLGDKVVVIGSGPIGLLHLWLARLKGARDVIVVDAEQKRLDEAKAFGATKTVLAKDEREVMEVMELTEIGADVVIEAVGIPQTWEKALLMCRKGGKVIFFGGCPPNTKASLDTKRIHYGEINLMGCFHHTPNSVLKAYELLSSGLVEGEKLVSKEMKLDKVKEALDLVSEKKAIKIAITMD
ncbi:MAG: alcohol dehydrogenase catalytic domain-containing protein [Nitrososphaerales archaeon]